MDQIDYKILVQLQENSRVSLSEISSSVNLSISAVSERLHKMEQSGLIAQYTTILNPEAFHKTLCLFVDVSISSGNDHTSFLEYVESAEDIVYCFRMAAHSDYYLRIVTENNATLEKVMEDLRSCPGVIINNVCLATRMIKSKPSIGPHII